MSNLWLDRPWWKRGLLYHLYLIILKDNYYRTKRAVRWARVNARLAVRWCVLYITGRRYTMPVTVDVQKVVAGLMPRFIDAQMFLREREKNNRSLLTGMVVALMTGSVPPYTGWEWYKQAARRKSNLKKTTVYRWVGRPSVYQYKNTKIGLTEFVQDYVPRKEQLAARRRLKEMKTA